MSGLITSAAPALRVAMDAEALVPFPTEEVMDELLGMVMKEHEGQNIPKEATRVLIGMAFIDGFESIHDGSVPTADHIARYIGMAGDYKGLSPEDLPPQMTTAYEFGYDAGQLANPAYVYKEGES